MTKILVCENLTKKFGPLKALDNVTLSLEPGVTLGYLGPNGAGKSTTIRLMMGLTRPTSGSVRVAGKNPFGNPQARALIGYSPGELRLDERFTVAQTLDFWSALRDGVDKPYREQLLRSFDLDTSRRVRTLSTGNRRKLSLIGALMSRPEVLILDEPSNGLDPVMQETLFVELKAAKDRGASILLSSHVMSEVESIADEVAIIIRGRLVAHGNLTEMRAGMPRRVSFTVGGGTIDQNRLMQIEGVSGVAQNNGVWTLYLEGSPTPLVRELARNELISLTMREPELEETFFAAYRNDIGSKLPNSLSSQGG